MIEIKGLYKSFDDKTVLSDINADFSNGRTNLIIGQNIEEGSVPIIGDNVWIGPGAKLFGKITVGDNTMIGANAVVCKSFSSGNCRIAGNPAKIISNKPNCYIRS